jgi:hypothetical protein
MEVRLAKGRRSGKAFNMAVCPVDGRHARLFINDSGYVAGVLARLEGEPPTTEAVGDVEEASGEARRSTTVLSEVEGKKTQRGGKA